MGKLIRVVLNVLSNETIKILVLGRATYYATMVFRLAKSMEVTVKVKVSRKKYRSLNVDDTLSNTEGRNGQMNGVTTLNLSLVVINRF